MKSTIFVSIETTAFSGATLLTFLLGAHPQIATVAEMSGLINSVDPDEYLCSCGQKIKDCKFWRSIKLVMEDKGFEFDVAHFDTKFVLNGPDLVQRLRTRRFGSHLMKSVRDKMLFTFPTEKAQIKALVDRNVAFVESVLEVTGKKLFVDSSKDRLRLKSLHRFSNLDTRTIHLVRDVRGFVASTMHHGIRTDVIKAAQDWVTEHRSIEAELKLCSKEKYIRIRYEDLCLNIDNVLRELYRFCEADPAFRVGNFREIPQHIVGNPMRLQGQSEIKLDQRWRKELSPAQIQDIKRVAGNLSYQYGYSDW